jgi:hypothetical protein
MTESTQATELDVVRRWLKAQLKGVMNVQSSFITQTNSMVVQTWTGVFVNVYFLDEAVKTRAIKRILQESSELGVGSLFIVKGDLLPADKTRFEPKEWLQALHEITRERIYLYGFSEDGPHLAQVHLEPVGATGQMVTRYGPPVKLEQLRYYKLSARAKFIRGDWHVADFGFYAFWRDPYAPYQASYRRPESNGKTAWRAWSQTTWEQDNTQRVDAPPQRRDKLAVCYELLAVNRDATREEVKAAFRKLALQLHPDTSHLPESEAVLRFQEVTHAYEYIKEYHNWV